MDKVWRGRLGWAALAVAAAAAVAYGFWPQPVPVDTAVIGRGDVIVTVEDEGVSQVREVYVVSSPVAGTMLRSPVEIGDGVTKDHTVVASILPSVQGFLDERAVGVGEAEIRAAEAALALAKANHERAESEAQFWAKQLTRMETLRRKATVSERTVDETRLEADMRTAAEASARAEVDLRMREVERAKAAMLNPPARYVAENGRRDLHVMAPETGVVLKIANESEAVVGAGAPLLQIGNPRDLEIVVDLLSRDAVRVRPGAAATIESWGGPPLDARVRRIDRTGFLKVSALGIEEQRVKVWLDLTAPASAWERLGHDYRIVAKIVVEHAENVLRVPASALFRQGESWAAFVVEDGRAKTVRLDIAEQNFEWAHVAGGLKENDTVILYPSDRLADGVRITQRRAE